MDSSHRSDSPATQATALPVSRVRLHACAACHQEWAETMMQRVESRWLCALCKERALGDMVPKEQRRYQTRMGVLTFLWLKTILGVALAASIGFRIWIASHRFRIPGPRSADGQLHAPADHGSRAPH